MLEQIVTTAVESTKVKNYIDNLHKIISSWASVARIQPERPGNASYMMLWAIVRHMTPVQLERQDTSISTETGRVAV